MIECIIEYVDLYALTENGLFAGKAGVSLSLYLSSKHGYYPEAEHKADEILESLINEMPKISDLSFDRGLTGIGFAINILHKEEYINGDIDDILYNIDASLYKFLCKKENEINLVTDFSNGLIGYLVYCISRLENPMHKKECMQHFILEAAIRIIIDRLYVLMSRDFVQMIKDLHTMLIWKFPILFYCLSRVYILGIYRNKISCIVNDWSFYICGLLPHYNINRLALANSLSYLNANLHNKKIESQIKILYDSINSHEICSEFETDINCINGGWIYAIVCLTISEQFIDKDSSKFKDLCALRNYIIDVFRDRFEEELQKSNEISNISLINGLCGINVLYSYLPYFLENK